MRGGLIRRAIAIGALAFAGALAPTAVAHAGSDRAVIVIGSSTYTVSFNGSITGLQALKMVASVETLNFGGQLGDAVCKINGLGNAPTPGTCLIGPGGAYWRYFRAAPGASGWQYSSQGAGSTTVTDGAVEGWYYGASGSPPFHSFCSVAGCAPPAPPTTVPATAPAGGSADGSGREPGNTSSATNPDGTPAVSGTDTTTTTTNAPGTKETDEQASGAPRGGRPEVDAGGGDGSPVGLAVAGGVVIALAGTGVWLRRRRLG